MNLDLLSGTLDIQDNPGLDTFDPRFSDVLALIEEANYAEAAEQSQAILEEKVYDIRIISYFLFGTFLEQGVDKLPEIFTAIINVLDENMEAIGPAKKREKGIANSLKWLFNQLLKKIEYEEKKSGELWNQWLNADCELVNIASETCEKLQKVLGRTLEDLSGPIIEIINKLKSWLDEFYQMVYKEPDPEVSEPEEEVIEESPSAPQQIVTQAPANQGSIPGSYHMQQLSIKLMTFQMLLKKQKYHLAAIVSDNISQLIADFNPKNHLPHIFSPYMQTYATHINEIATSSELKDTLEWQSLNELYKVDLQSFLGFNEALSYSTEYTPLHTPSQTSTFTETPIVESNTDNSSTTISNDDEWADSSSNDEWADSSSNDEW